MKILSEQAYEELLRAKEVAEGSRSAPGGQFATDLIKQHYQNLFTNVEDKIASMYEFIQTVNNRGVHYYDDCHGYVKYANLLLYFVTDRTEQLAKEAHELRWKLHNSEYPKENLYIDACLYRCYGCITRLQRAGQLIREQLQEQKEKEEGLEE